VVCLSTQKVRVSKPRLRKKGGGEQAEVSIPAYEAMQSDVALSEKLSSILMRGVSTRNYRDVIPEMAATCGVSKSSVSREFIEASAEQLQALAERRFDDLDLLVIYLDGVHFGGHHVIGAVGVDSEGRKHVLGLAEGATENAVVVKGLLESLVERGVRPDRRRLFVIDGSKALRAAIDAVFGSGDPVQRCRNHKVENVTGHLPQELLAQDTMYVGYLKGVGRIYQQTVVDTYSSVGFAKVYDTKVPVTAADCLNDRALPFFEERGVIVQRILTDRGTEYCGNPETHAYQVFLGLNDIEHTRTKSKHPQTNGICERFHQTCLNEFYKIAFRKRVYRSLDELQADLDAFVQAYNHERTHQGKRCQGRTPITTFVDALPLALEKQIGPPPLPPTETPPNMSEAAAKPAASDDQAAA
jgi:transposase InsO family protein